MEKTEKVRKGNSGEKLYKAFIYIVLILGHVHDHVVANGLPDHCDDKAEHDKVFALPEG